MIRYRFEDPSEELLTEMNRLMDECLKPYEDDDILPDDLINSYYLENGSEELRNYIKQFNSATNKARSIDEFAG